MSPWHKKRIRRVWIKYFYIPLVVILLFFTISSRVAAAAIHSQYISQVTSTAHSLLEGYSYTAITAARAQSVINQMAKDIPLTLPNSQVENLTEDISVQKIVFEIDSRLSVVGVAFIYKDMTTGASTITENNALADTVQDADTRIGLVSEYGAFYIVDGDPVYDAYMPVVVDGKTIGTLMTRNDISRAFTLAQTYTVASICSLFVFSSALFLAVMLSFSKSKKIVYLNYHDQITGLPNMSSLQEHLDNRLKRKNTQNCAVSVVGFDNFKTGDLKYGFEKKDDIIHCASHVISSIQNDKIRCFRISDEKFAFLSDGVSNEMLLASFTELVRRFQAPLESDGRRCYLTPKIGSCRVERAEDSTEKVLKRAATAAAVAGKENIPCFVFYSEEMKEAVHRKEAIESELREIIDTQDGTRLFLNYQPQVDLKTGEVHSFEALARMNSVSLGSIHPIEFISCRNY